MLYSLIRKMIRKVVRKIPFLSYLIGLLRTIMFKREMARQVSMTGVVRLNVGAGGTSFDGWISAEKQQLDITNPASFSINLQESTISHILAEHVVEHIYRSDFRQFLTAIRPFLAEGANIRIAVPDALHPSEYVRKLTEPGGLEPGADDHKEFYSLYDFQKLAKECGYSIQPIEYFDDKGLFHFTKDDWKNGYISRSAYNYRGRFTEQSDEMEKFLNTTPENLREQFEESGVTYTSLIVDFSPLKDIHLG